jgi:hypothetical protein
MNDGPVARVAYAVTHGSDPRVFLAEDETVLSRQLDEERAGLELRVAPIFDDGG